MSTEVIQATENEVLKSNSIIEAGYKLSNYEQKLIYLASKKTQQFIVPKGFTAEQKEEFINKHKFELLEFPISDFKKEFNIKSNTIYNEIQNVCNKLWERSIHYTEEDGTRVKKRWIITAKYNKPSKMIQLQFHPDLMYDLIAFNGRFTLFKFGDIKGMKSSYSFRIYELLKQYENLPRQYTIWKRKFTIDDLRFKLGIEDSEYPRYANFKQKVINKAIGEINEHTDITVKLEEIKQGRKVVGVQFMIELKPREKEILIDSQGNKHEQTEFEIKIPEPEKKGKEGKEQENEESNNQMDVIDDFSNKLKKFVNNLKDINESNYNTWFRDNTFELTSNNILVSVPNNFSIDILKGRYEDTIKKATKAIIGKELEIDYKIIQ